LLVGRLSILRFFPPAMITLAGVGDATQIRLHKSSLFEHEGELTISLFRSDLRLYSLTFTLGQVDAELVAYVGGLQGLRSPEANCPGAQIFSSYDTAWIECGGFPVDDAFFEMSPHLTQRPAKDTASRKRAQYRRRYAKIDAIAQQIGDALAQAPRPRA
jgi:uncharacterized protein VirK/YbjX